MSDAQLNMLLTRVKVVSVKREVLGMNLDLDCEMVTVSCVFLLLVEAIFINEYVIRILFEQPICYSS